jgi:anaerobic magnesium-protoporphyrin IX monomethyl ester cyclase
MTEFPFFRAFCEDLDNFPITENTSMRVMLINPPYPIVESLTMPLGLLYLAARLEQAGCEVHLEDLQLCRSPLTRLEGALLRHRPALAGITSFSLNLSSASKILQKVKRLSPGTVTVWGGPHVSFDDQDILRRHPWVDVVVRGEGEETLTEVVERVQQGKSFDGVLGVTWRGIDGHLQANPSRPFREDLDRLPRPAWHLLKLSQYRAFGDGASLMTSRGCPHRCVFCVGRKMIGAKGRFRKPQAVVDEMEALVRLGFRRIRIEDDLFTFRRERALAICKEMDRRELAVRWRAYSRVDTIDAELLQWMKRTGCERLLFGAESGSLGILKKIRKGITPEQTRQAVEMTRDVGIGVLTSFVLGLPGETPQTLRQTLEFAESLQVPYSLNLLTPYVGTEVREKAEEWGIQIHSDEWSQYGQGDPLTSTPTVTPWHLSRAVGKYRRGLRKYLEDLLEKERQGTLTQKDSKELEQNRHWAFLRRLIGEEILELYGNVPAESGRSKLEELARSLAHPLGMTAGEVEKDLDPLFRGGNICLERDQIGNLRYEWAKNKF